MQANILSAKELRKYKKHISLSDIGIDGQEKLKKAKALVLGAGSIGNPILLYLSATGIGQIGICDNDIIQEEDLQRQIIYKENDIGKHKAIIAKEYLASKNSRVDVHVYNVCIGPSNIENMISDYDVVVATTDHEPTLYLINDACVKQNKMFVYASINEFKGTLTVFNFNGSPNFRHLYPEGLNLRKEKGEGVYSVLPGIIGSLAANEVIKILLGIGQILSGKLLMFDALNMDQQIISY